MTAVGLAFVPSLGLLHLYAGGLRWIERLPEQEWLSFGAGVWIACPVVDVLPIPSAGQAVSTTLTVHTPGPNGIE
jgi:hypothetical protein